MDDKEKLNFVDGLTPMDFKSRFYQTSKFENYSKRKFMIDENKVNKINTYQNPFNYSETIKKTSKKNLLIIFLQLILKDILPEIMMG